MSIKFILAAAAALSFTAAPAVANDFGGVYVQGTVGVQDVRDTDFVYGANAGVNIPVGDAIVGVEAAVDNVFEDQRTLAASARLGYTFDSVMPYVEVGYEDYRDLDGLRVGGGVEYNISPNTFVSLEYRYTDFDNSRAGKHAGQIGLGLRF